MTAASPTPATPRVAGVLDRRYRRLAQRHPDADVVAAGWFDDGLDDQTRRTGSPSWLITPTGKLATGPDAGVVLLLTGALDPAHAGHVRALEAARGRLEATGVRVAGGYLAPDHDAYVARKRPDALPAAARVELARRLVADHPWIDVDPWPALGAGTPLNFTTIMDRLVGYLTHQRGAPVRVVFVYGSDNAGFAAVLGADGVCIGRDEAGSGTAVSSTRLRAQGHVPAVFAPPATGVYAVRDDAGVAVAGSALAAVDTAAFTRGLAGLLAGATGLEVRLRPVPAARGLPADVGDGGFTVSLDPWTRADAHLRLSRVFDCAAGQQRPTGLVAAPGAAAVADQVAGLPAEVVLVDDDIASGYTMREATRLLAGHGVRVTGVGCHTRAGTRDVVDVVDARDFLLGARHGGLVVRLPHGVVSRVPYSFPYVDLSARASIPADQLVDFSVGVWRLNAAAYTGTGLRVGDADPGCRVWLHHIGFDDAAPLAGVARWHLDQLTNLPCTPAAATLLAA